MKLATCYEIFLALCFVIVQITVKAAASSLSYENKNFVKIKQDPNRFQQASAYQNKNYAPNFFSNETTPRENNKINTYLIARRAGRSGNYSQDKYKIGYDHDRDYVKATQIKKWQVGRVSRKQYEIINMLWRKTKIFDDVESTTPNYLYKHNDTVRSIRQPFIRFSLRPSLSSTTPSFIEFYYLDEADERIKELPTQKYPTMKEPRIRHHGNHKFVLSNSPMFSFRIHDASYKRPALTTRYTHITNKIKRRKPRTRDSSLTAFDPLNSLTPSYKLLRIRQQLNKFLTNLSVLSNSKTNVAIEKTSTNSTTEYIDDNETCPTTVDIYIDSVNVTNDTTETENLINETVTENITQKQKSTTAYDKIKFFEMYDNHTPVPHYDEKVRYDMDNVDTLRKGKEVESKVLLEHVDQSIDNEHSQPHKAKPAKKHIIDAYKKEFKNQSYVNFVLGPKKPIKPTKLNVSKVAQLSVANDTRQPMIKLLQSESKAPQLLEQRKSQIVQWSQYPFAAAYVYEPLQVHCDAAGISPHWLITSGSCLSRHHKNPSGEGRSAFVTYCGVSWWNPERVAYVKYSLVHPRFHPSDKTRRHLYNVGLIQIVNSMASACAGWSSISLMSHQIIAESESTIANAVGWGLDRFDTQYSSNDLPKSFLTSYENRVYSHSCPGNIGYGKAKRLDEEGGIKNVYCLALPPYLGEATDPVHGGLLLVGGKLVALYLQALFLTALETDDDESDGLLEEIEKISDCITDVLDDAEERRPWGDQCAQYTGTWRLVPWILDIARENEDVDTFTLDI